MVFYLTSANDLCNLLVMALQYVFWAVWLAALIYALIQNGVQNLRPLVTTLALFALTAFLGVVSFGSMIHK